MKRIGSVFLVLLFACAFPSCTKKGCERICECAEDEYEDVGYEFNESECVEECVDDAKDEGGGCKKAVRKYGRCLDDNNCDFSDCEDEAKDLDDECDL